MATSRWRGFIKAHIIDDDPSECYKEPLTPEDRKWLDEVVATMRGLSPETKARIMKEAKNFIWRSTFRSRHGNAWPM